MLDYNPSLLQQVETIKENPSFTLTNAKISANRNKLKHPNDDAYFILSEAGKEYTFLGNNSILLNINKGYYVSQFHIETYNPIIIAASNHLFEGTEPISGNALLALQNAIKISAQKKPTLPNRR